MTFCKGDDCHKYAYYNYSGLKAHYCAFHKLDGMINVKNKKCGFEGCSRQPTYNYSHLEKNLYCSEHKVDGMVDVKHKKCIHEGCKVRPNFNYKDEEKPLYCSVHKLDGMLDINSKKCYYEGCRIRPIFNFINEKTPLYCQKHKLEGMINIVNTKCIYEGCLSIPNYNFIGCKKGLYCQKHKLNSMIDVKHKKCLYNECLKIPSYNFKNEKHGIYCNEHKLDDMIDVVHNRCLTPYCDTILTNKKYSGYCMRCYIYMYPDSKVYHNYKTKENTVSSYIREQFPDIKWIMDKTSGPSMRRPDIIGKTSTHNIIIEIDENQHQTYDCSCENKRLCQISQDFNHKPIVFLRFNPDSYITPSENISSCWTTNKLGICVIKKNKQLEWQRRLQCLRDRVVYWLQNQNDKTLHIENLFYDEILMDN